MPRMRHGPRNSVNDRPPGWRLLLRRQRGLVKPLAWLGTLAGSEVATWTVAWPDGSPSMKAVIEAHEALGPKPIETPVQASLIGCQPARCDQGPSAQPKQFSRT